MLKSLVNNMGTVSLFLVIFLIVIWWCELIVMKWAEIKVKLRLGKQDIILA